LMINLRNWDTTASNNAMMILLIPEGLMKKNIAKAVG
jgi:hypothetical protein